MDHLASVAEMAQEENEREDVGVENKHTKLSTSNSSSLKNTRKRNSDSDMYLSAEEKIDVNSLIASQDSYIFPRDDQLNYICVFQGCTKPILRGMTTEEYFAHLKVHGSQSDRLLSNMLRRVPSGAAVEQGDKKAKRRRANSTNTYNTINIMSKKQKDGIDGAFEKEDSNSSPNGSPRSPDSPTNKRTNSTDEYNIPLKPSSRGVQLRDQMLRYGLHLFRIDSEGKYICFFDECSLHMMTNFSRHIAKHEKNGDKIKQELLHLCSPNIVQQQLQQHPNLHMQPPAHSSHPQIPLQQLLLRHQQETLQLQQQQHQQQISAQSASQLEQLQTFHSMQFHQLQMQHNQQLQMFHQNLSTPIPLSPTHQQISQQNPMPMYTQQQQQQQQQQQHQQQQQQQQQHQEQMNKRPKNLPELSLLSQVRDESDLALMRTQISKMLEDSSRNHPNFSSLSALSSSAHTPPPQVPQKRSLSLAYYNSPSMQESPSLRHPYHPSPSTLNIPTGRATMHSPTLFSPRMQENNNNNNNNNFKATHTHLSPTTQENISPPKQQQQQQQQQQSRSPSSSPPSPPPSSEIKWIFPKNKPVLSK